MSSEYDFILDNMTYSFSSASTYETCPFAFFLSYIEVVDRKQNFFSEFGLFLHKILEMYFRDELEFFELSQYYKDHYSESVIIPPPPYPKGMGEMYYNDGLYFLDNFQFDKENYEMIIIEDKIEAKLGDIKLVVKPDLVLKNKETGKHVLVDYKTSKLKGNKYDEPKIAGYKRQFLLYAYFLWSERNIEVEKIMIWFIRNNQLMELPVDQSEMIDTITWFIDTIKAIKEETEWKANYTKENKYFCDQLCGVSASCPLKQG